MSRLSNRSRSQRRTEWKPDLQAGRGGMGHNSGRRATIWTIAGNISGPQPRNRDSEAEVPSDKLGEDPQVSSMA